MLLGEFRVKWLKEGTPDVSGDVHAKWGVVPNDVSLPIFSLRVWSLVWDVWTKFEEVLVSAVVEGFLIDWCCFVEGLLIVWNLGQTSINRLWNVADNELRVVRFLVDVEWNAVRLIEWQMDFYFLKKLWCFVGGKMKTKIWLYQTSW